ncbi:MAG TPA: hypothetical protein VM431_07280 [Phycisphaerae bacterium]|nr:hypothetical protein [Phycisphaerae bacterium]
MRRLAVVGCICVVLGGWAALVSAAPAAAKVDLAAVREKAAPAVGRVTVENAWGISQSVSTGFLMGDGRFAVVDLGAVRQTGAARATLHLTSGARLTATEFGMADPSMGLAVLRVEAPAAPTPALTPASRAFSLPASRALSAPSSESEPVPAAPAATESVPAARGLGLASALPVLDGTGLMATVGWRWGDRLDVTAGRVVRGPTIQSVASRSHVVPPQGVDSFLRVDGGRIDAASGSPVLDADGTVVAVRLDVAAKGLTVALAMPAMVLRQSLLESTTELKPLADLPAPLWPVDTLRLPGEPTSLAEFTQASQRIADAMVCDTCKGKGTLSMGGGGGRWGGRRPQHAMHGVPGHGHPHRRRDLQHADDLGRAGRAGGVGAADGRPEADTGPQDRRRDAGPAGQGGAEPPPRLRFHGGPGPRPAAGQDAARHRPLRPGRGRD